MLEKDSLNILIKALQNLEKGFSLPSINTNIENPEILKKILIEISEKLKDNYPYFHPLYAGQMLTPPHPVSRLAYMLSMWINPNNHALDGGRASSIMEKEAVAELAKMIGLEKYLGHLTSGGTMANLEALWIAGLLVPGKKILASKQAHYTHSRISNVLKLEFEFIETNNKGQIDLNSLINKLEKGNVGTVVATMGTTAMGAVDPLHKIIELRNQFNFRLHADAAYGGYFKLVDNLDSETQKAFNVLQEVDSIVIDPHKHGLQPYGCGCIIFKDPSVGRFYKHESPYTYFSSDELHLGEISLECSRAGAAAVALWATMKLLPLEENGDFAQSLKKCRNAAIEFYNRLLNDKRYIVPIKPELDIVCWTIKSNDTALSSKLAKEVFKEAAKNNVHLALAELPADLFSESEIKINSKTVTCLRSVLMKPEHYDWLNEIWRLLNNSIDFVLNQNK